MLKEYKQLTSKQEKRNLIRLSYVTLPLQRVLFSPVHCPFLPHTRAEVPSRTNPGLPQENLHVWL